MPKKNRTRSYKVLPFVVTYKPPFIAKVEAVYYHDHDLKQLLPILKKTFPKGVSISYDEITDRFDFEAWIDIDWSAVESPWIDNLQEFKDRILTPVRAIAKDCIHPYPCICSKKRHRH